MKKCTSSRRNFLKTLASGAVAASAGGVVSAVSGPEKRPPNVVLILTDDQGSVDVNCYGAKDLYTPNLDALAKEGTRFSQFYSAAPVCSPSRAALVTGRFTMRAGVPNNVGGDRGLQPEQTTIAEVMKARGYHTALFGKWHLGMKPEMSPLRQGFDEFMGHKEGCIDNYSHFFYWNGPNRHDLWRGDKQVWEAGTYFPDIMVREAHRFLEAKKDDPFFLYLTFNVPHYPLQAQKKYRDMYAGKEEPRAMYAAFVATMDEKIGQVVDKLDELGLREDTMVVFLSDHGHSVEERTFGGGGSSGPFRGNKFTLWEGGVRVPCIASWPGRWPQGEVRDQLAMSIDWLPTIAHYCGADLPKKRIDGLNIAGVIESDDAPSPHKVLYWQQGSQWAVREGNWKLVFNGPGGEHKGKRIKQEKVFLSDLSKDLAESMNLAKANPDVVERLTALHEAWAEDVKKDV